MIADGHTLQFLQAVQGVCRLLRVATFHAVDNEAVAQAMEVALRAIRAFNEDAAGLSMLFARDTAIVNGRLLQADPEVYGVAMEFGQFLLDAGVNSIQISSRATQADLQALLAFLRSNASRARGDGVQEPAPIQERLSQFIRLRRVPDHFLLGLEDPSLGESERVLLTYALATRVVRQQQEERREVPRVPSYFKRVARQLALADVLSRPGLAALLIDPRASADAARLAVNRAILTAAMQQRLARDEQAIVRACVANMLLELGATRPAQVPRAAPQQRSALAAGWAQIAGGQLRDDATERALVSAEALALLDGVDASVLYSDARPAATLSLLIVVSHRFLAALVHQSPSDPKGWHKALQRTAAGASGEDELAACQVLLDVLGEA